MIESFIHFFVVYVPSVFIGALFGYIFFWLPLAFIFCAIYLYYFKIRGMSVDEAGTSTLKIGFYGVVLISL